MFQCSNNFKITIWGQLLDSIQEPSSRFAILPKNLDCTVLSIQAITLALCHLFLSSVEKYDHQMFLAFNSH